MTITVRPYARTHSDAVLDLLFYARRQHTHLDWQRPGSYLEMPGALVLTAWEDRHLVGVIGCSDETDGTRWLRLLAIENGANAAEVVNCLWEALRARCQALNTHGVYLLVVNHWLDELVPRLGFTYVEDVVTLGRVGETLPELAPHAYHIQNAYLEALPWMLAIDHAAFSAPWQMERDELRQAQRQAASCTIALAGELVVGYQITTRHQNTSHLARLAVLPAYQGQGVGAVLLHEVLSVLIRRSVRAMTVNTQRSNLRSHHLYMRFGFRHNGYDLPVWLATL